MGKREEGARRSWRACGARPSAGSLPKEDCLKGYNAQWPKADFLRDIVERLAPCFSPEERARP
jgi:hypothetical protein